MIEINLAPPHLRKKKKKGLVSSLNIPREAIIGLIGGLFVLLILVHVVLQVIIFYKYALNKSYQKQWESILPNKEKVDVVMSGLRLFQGQTKSLSAITSGQRILWAPKLNAISDSIPREVWLSRLFFNEKSLLIQGSAVSKVKNEMISIGSFVSNLKKQENFMNGLSGVELGSIQRRKIRSVEVVDFIITSKLK